MAEHQRVFAYGSNMHLPDLRRWLREHGYDDAGSLGAEPARLRGYRLVWNYRSIARDGAAANAEPADDCELLGICLRVDDRMLAAIDAKEGHPGRYSRGEQTVSVERLSDGQSLPAWLYTVCPAHRVDGVVAPRRGYLRLMIDAAVDHGLDEDYVTALRDIPTSD